VYDSNLVVLNDSLYLLGGRYSYDDDSADEDEAHYSRISRIALDDTFPVGSSVVPAELIDTFDIPVDETSARANVLDEQGGLTGAWFYTLDTLYAWGGNLSSNASLSALSAFDAETKAWTESIVAGGNFNNGGTRNSVLWTSIPDSSLSFALGGDTPIIGDSMLRLDASNPEHLV
jgi:hypothetical protein